MNDVNFIEFGAWEVLVSQLILFWIFQMMRCQGFWLILGVRMDLGFQ